MIKYPLRLEERNVDYVTFEAFKYQSNSQGVSGERPDGSQPIILYMPNSTPAVGNMNSWGSVSFEGPLGEVRRDLGVMAAGKVQDMRMPTSIGQMKSEGQKLGQGVVDSIKGMFEQGKEGGPTRAGNAARQVGVNMVAGVAGTTPNALLAISKQQVYNPNVELIYQAPQLRQFSFDYTFLPTSRAEADAVSRIIFDFKKYSSPALTDGSMFEIPAVWQINYMTGGSKNQFMNKFKRAALIGVSVQDNTEETMHKSFTDGVPVSTSLNLQFQEVDVITRNDHVESDGQRGF